MNLIFLIYKGYNIMRLNWKTNKIQPVPDRSWNIKNNIPWWKIYIISEQHNFIGLMNYEEEYRDENGDILCQACVTSAGETITFPWVDVDYWISEEELQKFLLSDVNNEYN